ncbi:hypothetical protein L596_012972 [Steinernema carpocapsae]|uniref:Uncharacterized protein n=1 Tax=Steinernema carpocapsae TaxID=34508 RepID=A0A4U5NZL3_STECR|nr:hypothetical protein L596_012972 [Steinernema carpocapsae]
MKSLSKIKNSLPHCSWKGIHPVERSTTTLRTRSSTLNLTRKMVGNCNLDTAKLPQKFGNKSIVLLKSEFMKKA